MVARSMTKVEYHSLADAVLEMEWLHSILGELGVQAQLSMKLLCDNMGATSLTVNPIFHARMKHMVIHYHFIHERVADNTLIMNFIPFTN